MASFASDMSEVYAKWEKKSVYSANNRSSDGQTSGAIRSVESGRQAWRSKFKDVPQPPQRSSGRRVGARGSRTKPPKEQFLLTAFLGDFKRAPSIPTNYAAYQRPITHRCCKCLPISRDTYVHITMGMPDKTNVLDLPYDMCKHSRILRLFYVLTYTYRLTVRFGYPNMSESVLRSHSTQLAVERTVHEQLTAEGLGVDENSKEYKLLKKKCDKKLKKLFNKMKAVMSIPIFKVTGWFLHRVLGSLLNSVQVQNDQLKSLREASTSGKSMVYLPTHRSHLDYVLITFILWNYGIRAPYVAAGDNLNIPVFGQILRSLGGFFIRRRLEKEEGKRDHLYRAVLKEYVEELLKRGQSLEFFLEGGRSRSGKSLMPKAGLLSIVADFVHSSRGETDGIMNEDALIVPVSISYEKIMDGNFVREQIGLPKKKESFWGTAIAIWKLFSNSFGSVRVDFGQPFSLKEYMTLNQPAIGWPKTRGDSPVNFKDSTADLTGMPRSSSDNSIYGIDVSKEEQRTCVNSLAKHVIYSCISNTAVMSTHLVAFALLMYHRQGVTMADLIVSVDKLRQKILDCNRDLGFVGQSSDVIAHAARLFGPSLFCLTNEKEETIQWSDLYNSEKFNEITIRPNLSVESLLELTYYSNAVISVFQKQCLIVCALSAASGKPVLDASAQVEPVLVTRESVLRKAAYLADLLQFEFIFTAPCEKITEELDDAFESLISAEMVKALTEEDTYNEEAQRWTSRIVRANNYAFDDNDDYDGYYTPEVQYQVNMNERDLLWMYGRSLLPFIESYWYIACCLLKLLENDMTVESFNQLIHHSLVERVESSASEYPEIVAQDTMKNAVHMLTELKVLETYTAAGLKMISLTDQYNQEQSLHNLIATIGSFRVS